MSDLLQPGQSFAGRYRIQKFLAKGGFGAVYVAQQVETELKVALKVLWPHVLHSSDAVEKFKMEARIAGRVNSEHIVKVFDAGFDEATSMPFLVMEYLQGAELDTVVEQSGPLPPDRVVLYLRQVASALDKAHGYVDAEGVRQPIVHRDLKPENLFLTHRETGEPVVKVLDFGIAKVLNDSTSISQEIKGTPLYMAYEQACAGRITPQTDVWALGLIAFYLLTGRCYWKAASLPESSITQLFGEILSLPFDPPSQRARDISADVMPPPAFDEWFWRCVDREPSKRFATAGECVAALAVALGAPNTMPSPQAPVDVHAGTLRAPGVGAGGARVSSAASVPTERSEYGAPRNEVGMSSGSLALAGTKAPEVKRGGAPVTWIIAALLLVIGGAVVVVSSGNGIGAQSSAGGSVLSSIPPREVPSIAVPLPVASASAAEPNPDPLPSAAPSASVRPAEPAAPPQKKKYTPKKDPWDRRP